MKLLSIEETLTRVLAGVKPVRPETIELSAAGGRFVAESLRATIPLPRFNNSSMDGYAVRAAEARLGEGLRLAGEQPAGPDQGLTLAEGAAIRIYTGAPLPRGADAVIRQEDCERHGETICIREAVSPGENIRARGADLAEGQRLVTAGDRLSASRLAVLASQGLDRVIVFRRPQIAVIATGSELRGGSEVLGPGEIYETNRIMVTELIRQAGGDPVLFDLVADDEDQTVNVFSRGGECEAVVVMGGMSVGQRDYAKPALVKLGADIDLWRVAIKPGKPFLFGQLREKPVFGLPGNPVSAFVTFFVFVRPAILRMGGSGQLDPAKIQVPAGVLLENPGDRTSFFRGRIEKGKFLPVGNQASHALYGLSMANALARVDPGTRVEPGELVEAIWLGEISEHLGVRADSRRPHSKTSCTKNPAPDSWQSWLLSWKATIWRRKCVGSNKSEMR